ncbi:MAG: Ig-like domain-containing protein [Myxococcota bacterium]
MTPGPNRPPDAVDDDFDVPSNIDAPLMKAVNDSDPDGDPLVVVDVVQPEHGDVRINPNGTLTFHSVLNYRGPDFVERYTVTDGKGRF